MATRRRILQAIGGIGLLGGGYYVGQNGLSGLPGEDIVTGDSRSLDDTYDHNDLEITLTDYQNHSQITIEQVTGPRDTRESVSIEAPSNGTVALVRIEIKNTGIDRKTGPAWRVKNYQKMRKDEDAITFGERNDIRLFAGDSGGNLPKTRRLQFGINTIVADGDDLDPYPVSVTSDGPNISPDSAIEGWTFAVIESGSTPRLKMTLGDEDVWWDLE